MNEGNAANPGTGGANPGTGGAHVESAADGGSGGQSSADPVIGCYAGSGIQSIKVSSDGTFAWSSETASGTWKATGGGSYTFSFLDGNEDTVTLSNGTLSFTPSKTVPGHLSNPFVEISTSCSNFVSTAGGSSGSGCQTDSDCSSRCSNNCYQCLGGGCICGSEDSFGVCTF